MIKVVPGPCVRQDACRNIGSQSLPGIPQARPPRASRLSARHSSAETFGSAFYAVKNKPHTRGGRNERNVHKGARAGFGNRDYVHTRSPPQAMPLVPEG